MLFSHSFYAQAKSEISVSTDDVKINNNRLFEIEVCLDTEVNLSASKFKIEYDSDIMEYRGVKTDVPDSMVKAVNKTGETTAIFLNKNGVESGRKIKLFSVEFKSINSGSCEVKITADDCVDSKAKQVSGKPVGRCKVVVYGKYVASKTTGRPHDSDDKNDKEDSFQSKDKVEKDNQLFGNIDDSGDRDVYLLIIMCLVLIIVVGGAFLVKRMNKIEEKLNKSKEDNTTDE